MLPDGALVLCKVVSCMLCDVTAAAHEPAVYLVTGREGIPRQAGGSREERRRGLERQLQCGLPSTCCQWRAPPGHMRRAKRSHAPPLSEV